ncbi:MAG: hypothetical protein Q4D57_05095, partial [Clostridia bacterium]|nr:hypothetical protein [Clostridia bacterium]
MAVFKYADAQSVKPALDTPFMTILSRKLIKAAWLGKLDEFAERLAKYKWSGTRDYTMALIILSIIVAAGKDYDLKDECRAIKSTDLVQLFQKIGKGDGVVLKSFLDSSGGKWFKNIFTGLLGHSRSLADDKNDVKKGYVWDKFLKQVGKMKKWKINGDYIRGSYCKTLAHALGRKHALVVLHQLPKDVEKEFKTKPELKFIVPKNLVSKDLESMMDLWVQLFDKEGDRLTYYVEYNGNNYFVPLLTLKNEEDKEITKFKNNDCSFNNEELEILHRVFDNESIQRPAGWKIVRIPDLADNMARIETKINLNEYVKIIKQCAKDIEEYQKNHPMPEYKVSKGSGTGSSTSSNPLPKAVSAIIPKGLASKPDLWQPLFGNANTGFKLKHNDAEYGVPYLYSKNASGTKFNNYNYGYTDDQLQELYQIFKDYEKYKDISNWQEVRLAVDYDKGYGDNPPDLNKYAGWLGNCARDIQNYLNGKVSVIIPKGLANKPDLWQHLFGNANTGFKLKKHNGTEYGVPYLYSNSGSGTKFNNYNYSYTDDQLQELYQVFKDYEKYKDISNWQEVSLAVGYDKVYGDNPPDLNEY